MTARVSEWQATVVGAPGDGIGPAILIAGGGSRPGQQRAQYLVGAPEGFARLALEHKIRPSSALKAVFLPSLRPEAAGGVPGRRACIAKLPARASAPAAVPQA